MCLLWLIRHRITMPRTRTGMRFQPRCTCNQLPFTFNRRQHRSNTTIRRLRRQPPFRRRLHQHRPHQRPPSRDRLCRHHHRPRRRSRHRVLPGQLPGRIAKPIQSKPEANQPSIAEGFFWVMQVNRRGCFRRRLSPSPGNDSVLCRKRHTGDSYVTFRRLNSRLHSTAR